jgi:AcrR family transcriptional regulator
MSPAGSATTRSGTGTRRRGEALRTAILQAALEELRTTGYTSLSMDSVAAAAGTGKAALYRRWPNRDELVFEALSSALPDPAGLPLTGDPRTDLLAVLHCMRDTFVLSYGSAFRVVRREASTAQSLVHNLVEQRVMGPCHALTLDVLRRGIAAGRVRPGADNDRVADVGAAMLVHAVVTSGVHVSDAYLTAVVDDVIMPLVSVPG